jgi:hypothetical protein
MQRPDMAGSAEAKADTGTSLDASYRRSPPSAGPLTRHASPAEEAAAARTEADQKRRARRQALVLMVVSGIVTMTLLAGAWVALRRVF